MVRQQYIFSGLVNRAIDGDTYDITLDLGFYVSHPIRVRLKGVDTPEVYG
jgi:endonuclease YncB( thermonuclease family)